MRWVSAMAGFRFIFAIFTVSVLLILAVYLRNSCDRTCHLVYSAQILQNRLTKQLSRKQLQLEGYMNPAALSQTLQRQ